MLVPGVKTTWSVVFGAISARYFRLAKLVSTSAEAIVVLAVKSVIVGGGVSANQELRKQFKKKFENVLFPKKEFSTDNAVMIAIAGYYNKEKGTKSYSKIKAKSNLRIS